MLRLTEGQLNTIRQHGEEGYPYEICGLIAGHAKGDDKTATELILMKNIRDDSPENRYLIDPQQMLEVDKQCRERGLDVVGYYHSHPDHPARPSDYDRDHAWPWWSYVIVSIYDGQARDLTCWVLDEAKNEMVAEEMPLDPALLAAVEPEKPAPSEVSAPGQIVSLRIHNDSKTDQLWFKLEPWGDDLYIPPEEDYLVTLEVPRGQATDVSVDKGFVSVWGRPGWPIKIEHKGEAILDYPD